MHKSVQGQISNTTLPITDDPNEVVPFNPNDNGSTLEVQIGTKKEGVSSSLAQPISLEHEHEQVSITQRSVDSEVKTNSSEPNELQSAERRNTILQSVRPDQNFLDNLAEEIIQSGGQDEKSDFERAKLAQGILLNTKQLEAIFKNLNEVKLTLDEASKDVEVFEKKRNSILDFDEAFKKGDKELVSENVENLPEKKSTSLACQLALAAIKERLPVLLKAYQAIEKGSAEAKSHFVQLCRSEMSMLY